ncbi:MAG: lysozyme [Acinetobacter sp.]
MQNKSKVIVTGLTASAAFFAALIGFEGYKPKPYLDTGEVATIGIGSTVYEDGTKVKMTDKPITQKRAIEISKAHVAKDEVAFRKSLTGVKLSQVEYDSHMDFVYNFGISNWNKSSMLKNLRSGNYVSACKSLLKYKYVNKRDCSIKSNNCYGVWTRQKWRYDQCMSANK